MAVFVPLQKLLEEWAGGDENHLVGLDLLTILTGQGQICEVLVISQLSESRADIVTEVVPLQTQLFIRSLHLQRFLLQLVLQYVSVHTGILDTAST